jgi:PAS domain S-box-containing protein
MTVHDRGGRSMNDTPLPDPRTDTDVDTDAEARRLARLRALRLLDTAAEPLFDRLTRMASRIAGTPIALVSLVDAERQWFKANFGLEGARETPRAVAFCAHTIQGDAMFEVPDAREDRRFAANPLVTGEPHVRFYAGVPLRMSGGERIGTLCVIDHLPRQLDANQREMLADLGAAVVQAIELREQAMLVREAEAALTASEAKYRTLSDALPVGVYHTDSQGLCTYTNEAWQAITGLTLAQSLGEGWATAIHPEDRDEVFARWSQSAAGGGRFAMHFRMRRPSGEARTVDSRAQPLLDAAGHIVGYVGSAEDVTERLAADERLRESEAFLDRTGRLAGVGGWEVRLPQVEIRWSDQTCRIHDLEPGHRPDMKEAVSYYRDGSEKIVEAAVQRAIDEGVGFDLELPFRTARQRDIWVRAVGEVERVNDVPARVVGAFQDVTRSKEAELALERSNAALRQLYEQTPAMMHSIDSRGRMVTVSDEWLARLGYRREEVIGCPSVEFLTPASRDAVIHEHLPRLWREGRNERLSLQMLHRDGSVLDVLLSAILERDPKGQPVRALAVIEDVTAVLRRAAELEHERVARRQIEHQADELARLAAERREMLDVLAHEVRQPLNNASAAIQSAGSLLAEKGEQAASARLVRAQGVLSDVQSQVENTLALSTLISGSGAPAPPALPEEESDIDTVLAVSLGELPAAARERVQVERVTAARSALMDSALVRLALRNLLSNAIRHTPGGTPVHLRVSDSEQPLALLIDVVDEGPGLPAQMLPRLFERGARMRHADGRTSHGLGLFIAHRALLVQGGRLELLRSDVTGTALRLVLPQGRGD